MDPKLKNRLLKVLPALMFKKEIFLGDDGFECCFCYRGVRWITYEIKHADNCLGVALMNELSK